MSTRTPPDVKRSTESSLAQYWSIDPEKQKIELSFLQRYVDAKEVESAKELHFVVKVTPENRFSAAHSKMQSSAFRVLSSLMEKSVPEEKGFGKFRGRG